MLVSGPITSPVIVACCFLQEICEHHCRTREYHAFQEAYKIHGQICQRDDVFLLKYWYGVCWYTVVQTGHIGLCSAVPMNTLTP